MTDYPRYPETIVERANDVVDRARQIMADAGALPHRVFVVLYKWSGGEVKKGEPRLESFLELTPPPEVLGEDGLKRRFTGGGNTLEGSIRLEGISPRYTETDLDVLTRALGRDEEIFIEVVHDGRDGSNPDRRAFKPIKKPMRRPLDFDWVLELQKSDDDRTRYGNRRYWSGQ